MYNIANAYKDIDELANAEKEAALANLKSQDARDSARIRRASSKVHMSPLATTGMPTASLTWRKTGRSPAMVASRPRDADHMGAGLGQGQCGSASQSLAGAGDQGYLTGKVGLRGNAFGIDFVIHGLHSSGRWPNIAFNGCKRNAPVSQEHFQ